MAIQTRYSQYCTPTYLYKFKIKNVNHLRLKVYDVSRQFLSHARCYKIDLRPADLGISDISVILDTRKIPAILEIAVQKKLISAGLIPTFFQTTPQAFGKTQWEGYFGDVGEEPPLPENINEILEADCPIYPGKKVKETHQLVLIPKTVNGQPLTLKSLISLVEHPKVGNASTSLQDSHTRILNQYGDFSADSYWVLIMNSFLPESINKDDLTISTMIATYSQNIFPQYQIPTVREAAICSSLVYVSTGTRLYSSEAGDTLCQEQYEGPQVVIKSSSDGSINKDQRSRLQGSYYGTPCLRKFPPLAGQSRLYSQYCSSGNLYVFKVKNRQDLVIKIHDITDRYRANECVKLKIDFSNLNVMEIPSARVALKAENIPSLLETAVRKYLISSSYAPSSFRATTLSLSSPEVPIHAFGQDKWRMYFGEIGREPSLPQNIDLILDQPCPFWPDKKVKKTHMLVLMPVTVNGQLLTLRSLGLLIQRPLQGNATHYVQVDDRVIHEHGDTCIEHSYWVLMTRSVIPDSIGKIGNQSPQILASRLIAECNQKSFGLSYQVPKALETAVCTFLAYISSGTRIYSIPETYTWSQEKVNGAQVVIGGSAQGISLMLEDPRIPRNHYGTGCLMKF